MAFAEPHNAHASPVTLYRIFFAFKDPFDEFTGFTRFDLNKLKQMLVYFSEKSDGEFETKLNKLVFYADFLHCKRHAKSISGTVYAHANWGPVPNNYKFILLAAESEGLIKGEEVNYKDYTGTLYKNSVTTNKSVFTPEELKTMDDVFEFFKGMNSGAIAEYSHKEKAYIETGSGEPISYKYCMTLSI